MTGECLRGTIIGKPYSGKLNVRFDEGELEIEPSATTPALYSTAIRNNRRENLELLKEKARGGGSVVEIKTLST
jgi:hypothetical protein